MSATPSSTPLPLTGSNAVDSITTGYYWQLDASRTLNWSISNGFEGQSWINQSVVRDVISTALNNVSYYADINFNYTGFYSNPIAAASSSQLNFSLSQIGSLFSSNSIWALGFFPSSEYDNQLYKGAAGDFYLNVSSAANYLPSYDFGTAGYALFLHEIGHILGLKHTHDDGGTGRPTLTDLSFDDFDMDWFSVMSYRDDFNWNLLSWEPATFMALDAIGLMAMYGKNMSTNAGDDFVSLVNINSYVTRWDAGGNDTLSAYASNEGWFIYLKLAHNETVDVDVGIASPLSAWVYNSPTDLVWLLGKNENVLGSNYADHIIGNEIRNEIIGNDGDDWIQGGAGDDVIAGGRGDDFIDGGSGIDTAIYNDFRSNYSLLKLSNGYTVSNQKDGRDTLTNVERLLFSDQRLALDVSMTGNAGQAMAFIGTIAPGYLDNLSIRGLIIGMFDDGYSMLQLSELALQLNLVPNATAAELAQQICLNVSSKTPEDLGLDGVIADYIDQYGEAAFVAAIAGLHVNVDLVGLAETGIAYI